MLMVWKGLFENGEHPEQVSVEQNNETHITMRM